jgi:two-component sensor histidine kinase
MAAAQRVLYDTIHAARFSGPQFLKAVCETVGETLSPPVSISCDAVACELSNDSAMPLALILNELMTNAAKYGVNGQSGRAIRVGLLREEESYVLLVEDQGSGFDLTKVRKTSSGLRLVEGLARQLGGTFTVSSDGVTRCCVTFPALSGDGG